MRRCCYGIGLLLASLPVVERPVCADLIKLNNGGEIRGTMVRKIGKNSAGPVTIETLSGSVVVVERSHIQFVTRRPLIVEEYETRAKSTPATVKALWELAEWCRQSTRLKKQRAECLQRIVELNPDHEKAHRGLGHTKRTGQWMTRDAAMKAQGYVKFKNRYVTPQELELIEKTNAELARERTWYKKIRQWRNWLTGRNAERSQIGLDELRKIDNPVAVSSLERLFSDDPDKQTRGLYVGILSQIPGPKPVPALVNQSLNDVDYEIRYEALNGLAADQYEAAMPLYARQLKSGQNPIVRRAAAALNRVGDERVVPNLIEALVTTHRYRVRVPDRGSTIGFRSDGAFGSNVDQVPLPPNVEIMLRTGQLPNGVIVHPPPGQTKRTKLITIKHEHKNAEVLSALQKLTGQSFAYDERTWRLWWAAEKAGAGKTSPSP